MGSYLLSHGRNSQTDVLKRSRLLQAVFSKLFHKSAWYSLNPDTRLTPWHEESTLSFPSEKSDCSEGLLGLMDPGHFGSSFFKASSFRSVLQRPSWEDTLQWGFSLFPGHGGAFHSLNTGGHSSFTTGPASICPTYTARLQGP